jgi:hypothetical protein
MKEHILIFHKNITAPTTRPLPTDKENEINDCCDVYKCNFGPEYRKNLAPNDRISLEALFVGLRHAPHEGS